ncbi:MAG: DUF2782 domain-containing protein [Gammaproteobacteria bacterium]|nr:DUF2782 domain-containing protein [Gammaproteobacteria bacterium]
MQGRVFRRSLSWLGLLSTVTLSWTFVYAQDEAEATPRPSQQGPDVVLRESPERTIYEYRQNGTLTMIKIVPKKGRPYFLVPVDPTENFGELDRAASLKPQWVIREF